MARSKQTDAGQTQRTVFSGVLESLGKGFLIATAGLVAGLMFGTQHMPMISLWTVAVAAAGGVGCMIGSVVVKNAECNRRVNRARWSPHAANVRKAAPAVTVMEPAQDVAPDEWRARRRVLERWQRDQGASRSV
jgi:hypothetical protein